MRSPAELGLVVFDLVARWWRAAQQTARRLGGEDVKVIVRSGFDEMKAFFGNTGAGHASGVWEAAQGVPQDRPEFKAEQQRLAAKAAKKRKAEEMG